MRVLAAISLVLIACAIGTSSAYAYSDGVSFIGCRGCHGSGEQTVEIFPIGAFREGQTQQVRMVVTGSGSGLGFFVRVDGGTLSAGPDNHIEDQGVTHDRPQAISGGTSEIEFSFRPTSSAVRFEVSTLVTNGDGRRGGDRGATEEIDFVIDCEGRLYYRDQDEDMFGSDRERLFCDGEPGEGYVAETGDCNDFRDEVFPGAPEPCNQRDDNCNDIIDDDAEEVVHYRDRDRDGFYSREEREEGDEFFGCSEVGSGWAARGGDCAPEDPERNPDADEVCDMFDNDCDSDVDERVRPTCGVGWCRRAAQSCDGDPCTPGPPREEMCNLFDDDCDDVVDEDSCPSGQVCEMFECIDEDEVPPDGPAAPEPTTGSCAAAAATNSWWAFWILIALVAVRPRLFRTD